MDFLAYGIASNAGRSGRHVVTYSAVRDAAVMRAACAEPARQSPIPSERTEPQRGPDFGSASSLTHLEAPKVQAHFTAAPLFVSLSCFSFATRPPLLVSCSWASSLLPMPPRQPSKRTQSTVFIWLVTIAILACFLGIIGCVLRNLIRSRMGERNENQERAADADAAPGQAPAGGNNNNRQQRNRQQGTGLRAQARGFLQNEFFRKVEAQEDIVEEGLNTLRQVVGENAARTMHNRRQARQCHRCTR